MKRLTGILKRDLKTFARKINALLFIARRQVKGGTSSVSIHELIDGCQFMSPSASDHDSLPCNGYWRKRALQSSLHLLGWMLSLSIVAFGGYAFFLFCSPFMAQTFLPFLYRMAIDLNIVQPNNITSVFAWLITGLLTVQCALFALKLIFKVMKGMMP